MQADMLSVLMASGKELAAIPVEQLTNVEMLKKDLQKLCGVPRFRQRLIEQDGTCLEDHVILDTARAVHLLLLPFAVSGEGARALTEACAKGLVSKVQELLQFPIDPNCRGFNDDGLFVTPIIVASHKGHVEVVRLLLEAGADKNWCDPTSNRREEAASMASQILGSSYSWVLQW